MPEPEVAATGTTPDAGSAAPVETATPEKPVEGFLTGEAAPETKDGEASSQTETKDEKPAPAAPEKYELKMPEGITLDEAAWAEFEPLAREANLTNEAAQKVVDLKIKLDQIQATKMQEAWTNQQSEWMAAIKTDPELGGQQFDATRVAAQSVLAKYGTPDLNKFLEVTGFTNNPEVVRVFARIGKAMAEDKFTSVGGAADTRTPAQRMFPNMN